MSDIKGKFSFGKFKGKKIGKYIPSSHKKKITDSLKIDIEPFIVWDYHPDIINFPRDGLFSESDFIKYEAKTSTEKGIKISAIKKITHKFGFDNKLNNNEFSGPKLFPKNINSQEVFILIKKYLGFEYDLESEFDTTLKKYSYSLKLPLRKVPHEIGYKSDSGESAAIGSSTLVSINKESALNVSDETNIKNSEGELSFNLDLIALYIAFYYLMTESSEKIIRNLLKDAYTNNFLLFKKIFYSCYHAFNTRLPDIANKTVCCMIYSTGEDDGNEGFVLVKGRSFAKKYGIIKGSKKKTRTGDEESNKISIIRELNEEISLELTEADLGSPSLIKTNFGEDDIDNYVFFIKVKSVPKPKSVFYDGETTQVVLFKKADIKDYQDKKGDISMNAITKKVFENPVLTDITKDHWK